MIQFNFLQRWCFNAGNSSVVVVQLFLKRQEKKSLNKPYLYNFFLLLFYLKIYLFSFVFAHMCWCSLNWCNLYLLRRHVYVTWNNNKKRICCDKKEGIRQKCEKEVKMSRWASVWRCLLSHFSHFFMVLNPVLFRKSSWNENVFYYMQVFRHILLWHKMIQLWYKTKLLRYSQKLSVIFKIRHSQPYLRWLFKSFHLLWQPKQNEHTG